MKHTPTPWFSGFYAPCGAGVFQVTEPDATTPAAIAVCYGPDAKANAAFIALACNSHADLVAALERLLWLETSQGVTDEEFEAATNAASEALSKAKGE